MVRPAAWPLRLPIIRHIRAMIATYRVNRHYDMWKRLGFLPTHAASDYAVVDQIRAGKL